jgi:asparagine synthase (glutamine-hydrolysing)
MARLQEHERITESFIHPEFAERVLATERLADQRLRCMRHCSPGSAQQRAAAIFNANVVAARERYEREAARVRIEARAPYYDINVIRFCVSLPTDQMARDGWKKSILRRAMHQELPRSVLWRPGRTQLGWPFTQSVMRAARPTMSRTHDRDLEAVSPYIVTERFSQAAAAWQRQGEVAGTELQQYFRSICLARWLAAQSENNLCRSEDLVAPRHCGSVNSSLS